jgi:hypothetical protein
MLNKIIPSGQSSYYLENRVPNSTGIGRIANELSKYLDSCNVEYKCSQKSFFNSINQFSPFNLFLLIFNSRSSYYIFPYTIFPPLFLNKVKYTFCVNDLYQFDRKNFSIKNSIFKYFFIKFCTHSTKITFISNSTYKKFVFHFGNKFDSKNLEVCDCTAYPSLSHAGKNCLFLGSSKTTKNITFLNELLKVFISTPNSGLFFIIGLKPDDVTISSDRIVFLNKISEKYLSFLFSKTDIYLSTSTDEGFSFPVYDAFHNGLLIYAFKIPVFEEFYSSCSNVKLFSSENKYLSNFKNLLNS